MPEKLPTAVHEHLEPLPDAVKEQLGSYILGLSHPSLHPQLPTTSAGESLDGVEAPDYSAHVESADMDQEQIGHSQRVEAQMERAALFVRRAHDELGPDAEQGLHTVYRRAVEMAADTAKQAKEAGDEQTAIESLETYFVVQTFMEDASYMRHDEAKQQTLQTFIEDGMAPELLEAAKNTSGIVHISEEIETSGVKAVPITATISEKANTLRLATQTDFDELYAHSEKLSPEREQQILSATGDEKIGAEDLTVLATVAKEKGDIEKAAGLALMAIERLPDTDTQVVRATGAKTITQAAELCEQLKLSPAYNETYSKLIGTLHSLRAVRRAGEEQRHNNPYTYTLDAVLVELAEAGQADLVKEIISASERDDPNARINHFPEASDAARDLLAQAHSDAQNQVMHKLQTQGLSESYAKSVLKNIDSPEEVADIQDKGFWEMMSNHELSQYVVLPDSAEAIVALSKMHRLLASELGDAQITAAEALQKALYGTPSANTAFPELLTVVEAVIANKGDDSLEERLAAVNKLARHGTQGKDRWDFYAKIVPADRVVESILSEELDLLYRQFSYGYLTPEEKEAFDRSIQPAFAVLGQMVNRENLLILDRTLQGESMPELQSLGVTKTGEAGLDQLKAVLSKFNEQVFTDGTIPIDQVIENPILLAHFKGIVRFDQSQWGSHENESLKRMLEICKGREDDLAPEFVPRDVLIATLDTTAKREFTPAQEGMNELRSYVAAIERAKKIIASPGGSINVEEFLSLNSEIKELVSTQAEKLGGGITKLQEVISKKQASGNDVENLEKQLAAQQAALEQLTAADSDLTDVEDFSVSTLATQIKQLAENKTIAKSDALKVLLIATAMMAGEGSRFPEITGLSPELEDFEKVADFIGHATNEEIWRDHFQEIGGRKQLDYILSIDALNDTIKRGQNLETSGTKPFRFIPSRGPLLELSGHVGDACWASKYDSIAEEFPNMTAVTFVQNPDTASQRTAGAALLIQTESAEGEPLLVLRGINPIQNVITDLSQEGFFEALTGYASEVAAKQGRKVAVVIDDHSGGSATNRPGLFTYLDDLRKGLTPVRLASEQGTTFNGYNIVNDTYLVPSPTPA